MDEWAEGELGVGPDLMRSEMRGLVGRLIVQMDGVTEGKGPEAMMIMLRPVEGGKDHDGSASPNCVLDGIFGNTIVMMPVNAAMFDALALRGQFGGKFLGDVDTIVTTIMVNINIIVASQFLKSFFRFDCLDCIS